MSELNFGKTTLVLMLICAAVFIIELLNPSMIDWLSFSSNKPATIVISAFAHGGYVHLFYNLFALFIFGNMLEVRVGSKKMIVLFFASVITANLSFALFFPGVSAVGISGFIYALIGALMMVDPRVKMPLALGYLMIAVPIIIAGPLMMLGELLLSFMIVDGIAHIAHLTGFLLGFLLGAKYLKVNLLVPFSSQGGANSEMKSEFELDDDVDDEDDDFDEDDESDDDDDFDDDSDDYDDE